VFPTSARDADKNDSIAHKDSRGRLSSRESLVSDQFTVKLNVVLADGLVASELLTV
jgi:hypothetical protein